MLYQNGDDEVEALQHRHHGLTEHHELIGPGRSGRWPFEHRPALVPNDQLELYERVNRACSDFVRFYIVPLQIQLLAHERVDQVD